MFRLKSLPLTMASAALRWRLVDCHSHRIAIARPFSPSDVPKLAASFDIWDTFTLCNDASEAQADLFLVYSQSLDDSVEAQSAIEQVQLKFLETNGWNKCINTVMGLGVDIDPAQDIYNSKEQSTNPLWVNGPNRQFERTVRYLQTTSWGQYDVMYLMEMDSVPVRDLWLDAIVYEIHSQSPDFAILGSKYRGDKWDPFYSQLPTSLVNHINGNAIYNLNNPLFNLIVDELEKEAFTVANSIAYDYRISQMIEESKTGVVPSFTNYDGVDPMPPKSETFIAWNRNYDVDNLIKEISIFANYASTNMIPSFLEGGEYIIHGANMFSEWNDDDVGKITLVVSDWEYDNSHTILSQLEESSHPFKDVVVMLPATISHADYQTASTSTPIRFISRGSSPDFMDLCTAPVKTRWFMMTDSFHQLRHTIRPMVQTNAFSVKPVVSYSKISRETCLKFPFCIEELKSAWHFFPKADKVFENQDFVFLSSIRDEYCSTWNAPFSNTTFPPSATSFMAYLRGRHLADEIYYSSDRSKSGSRKPFLTLADNALPQAMLQRRRLQSDTNQTNVTTTTYCANLATDSECIAAGCEWRRHLASCRENNFTAPSGLNDNVRGIRSRPKWVTVLISLAIACGGVAFLMLVFVGVRQSLVPSATDGIVRQPSNHSEDLENDSGELQGVSFLTSDPDDDDDDNGSMETIHLGTVPFGTVIGGDFDEMSEGVEFVRDRLSL